VIPLTDLGLDSYSAFTGGLYPNGKNSRPSTHEKAGVALAATVRPVNEEGKASMSGKVVMISIGMSNTSREFSQFIRLADADARKNPSLVIIDAARNGAAATEIADPGGDYWRHVDRQLQRGEVTAGQVQVVWLKTVIPRELPDFPQNAQRLQEALHSIVEILGANFPQLKLVYVSSRIYGGYSETDLHPEPLAYESGFAVKWLIEERINNPSPDRSRPWVSWGPYLWADGMTPRRDGLIWERSDFEPDGVHPSAQGALKVGTRLFQFFESDSSAQPWFFTRHR
jgi:hypothetical protein